MLTSSILRLTRNLQSFRLPANVCVPKRTYFNWLSWLNIIEFKTDGPENIPKWVNLLNDPNIDGFDIRRHIMKYLQDDLVPEPQIVEAAIRACRRVNDYALAIRIFEIVKLRSGADSKAYDYVMSEIRPTIDELGLNTLEELGFDKPIYWVEFNQLCE